MSKFSYLSSNDNFKAEKLEDHKSYFSRLLRRRGMRRRFRIRADGVRGLALPLKG